MRKWIVLLVGILLTVGLFGCGNLSEKKSTTNTNEKNKTVETSTEKATDTEQSGAKKSVVVYFSRTNHTEKVATYIAEITGADRYEIEAKDPYTDEDIDYNNSSSRANREQKDDMARPEIGSKDIDLSAYDTIYLGYPIWWGEAPKIMYTFVEKYDLSGKTIAPFCTSASSGVGSSATNLAKSAPQAKWLSGKRFSASASKSEAETWLKGIK